MNFDRENVNNSLKKEFKFQTENTISLKKFNIDSSFSYLNLKVQSDHQKNPVVYAMLIDPNNILRIQYRSINSINNIIVGKDADKCSVGTYPGNINSGEWKLIIISLESNRENYEYSVIIECINELKDEKVDKLGDDIWVDYNKEDSNLLGLTNYDWNKNFNNEKRWYKGDFHTHSIISDGKMDGRLYMKVAKEMNLDFAVPTEHNIIPTGWEMDKRLLIIPGTEITLFDGHFNILGVRKFPLELESLINNYDEKNFHEFQENIVKEVVYNSRDEKSLYSVNHMALEFWKWKFLNVRLDKFDTIEICNDPTYYLGPESNDKVINMLYELWNDGYRIYGIGGSDAHILPTETYDNSNERSIIGDPGTFVYCDKLTPNNIIDSVKHGHVYVSRGIILDINIEVISSETQKSYLPGDEIEIYDCAEIKYSINIKLENLINEFGMINKADMPLKLYFVKNGVKIEKIISKEGKIDFYDKWNRDEFKYLSVEIRDMEDKFKCYVNPIYHGHKEHKLVTFKDLFEKCNYQ